MKDGGVPVILHFAALNRQDTFTGVIRPGEAADAGNGVYVTLDNKGLERESPDSHDFVAFPTSRGV